MIEPTIEHGYAELERLQALRKRFDGDFPYDYADLRAPIELFKASLSARGDGRSDSRARDLRGAVFFT